MRGAQAPGGASDYEYLAHQTRDMEQHCVPGATEYSEG